MKRQKSLLLRLLTIVTITILAPSILTFLVFFRTVPERMETQAQANVGFYIDQTHSGSDRFCCRIQRSRQLQVVFLGVMA